MIAPKTSEAAGPRVALCPLGGGVPRELTELLARRGVASRIATLSDALRTDVGAIAAVARSLITANMCVELAPLCRRAAEAGCPIILLAPPSCFASGLERTQLSAYLEGAGAVVWTDPDAWLETTVMIAAFGIPRGPRTALVLPTSSWLDDAAEALSEERAGERLRVQACTGDRAGKLEPTDILLCDPSQLPSSINLDGLLVVPITGRGELVVDGGRPILVGLRASLRAAAAAGHLRLRIDEGLGDPAERDGPDDIDRPRIEGLLARLYKHATRIGDHETKLMLAAAGVNVTRQATAETASAAIRHAKRAGFPVQMKPWGADIPDELSGCPLETDLETAADVRRAFAALATETGSAIVRETPPDGRELSAEIVVHRVLGAMMTVRVSGQHTPLAAVSPLSDYDAERLGSAVVASRVGDPEPAQAEVANILRRASYLARDVAAIRSLAMPRIVAGDKVAVVVDAWAGIER